MAVLLVVLGATTVSAWVFARPFSYAAPYSAVCHGNRAMHERAIVMQQLSAGSQFVDRPMKDINKSGPTEDRLSNVQALMAKMEASGEIGAARANMVAAKKAEMASMPKMDSAIEEEHRSEIELAKLVAADMMRVGDIEGAVKALRAVQKWLCAVTELGSSVLMDLAMALDAKRDPEAAHIFATLSASPNEDVRSLAKLMASMDENEEFLKY